MKKLNFTIEKMLSFLEDAGKTLLGTALGLYIGTPPHVVLAAKFAALGVTSIFLSFLLGLIKTDLEDENDCTKVVFVKKVKKKTKKNKKSKRKKK